MATYRVDTRTLNSLVTTTLDSYSKEMADVIFGSNYGYYMLKEKGCFHPQEGGTYLDENVMFEMNSTAAWYEGYETIDVTPQDGMTNMQYPWAELAAAVSISRREERINSGRSRLLNLLEKKIFQAEETLIYKVNLALQGTGRFNVAQTTREMAGLRALIPEVPASYDAGGLDGDNTWWQNKVLGNSGTAFTWLYASTSGTGPVVPTGIQAMRVLYNNCSKGSGGHPDIILCGQYMYESYEAGLGAQHQYTSTKEAEAGYDVIKFRGAKMYWDEEIVTASVTKDEAASSKAVGYFINSKTFKILYDSQSLFSHEGFIKPENQTARTALIVYMGNTLITNRKKNGIMVDANITAIR